MANDMTTNEALDLGKALGRQFAGVAKLGEICDRVGALAGREDELKRNIETLKDQVAQHLVEIESLKQQKAVVNREAAEAVAAREEARRAANDAKAHQKDAEAKKAATDEAHAKAVAAAQVQKDALNKQITDAQAKATKIEAEHQARVEALRTEQDNIATKIESLKNYHDSFKSRIAPLLTA